jgi:hypothetical protein
MNAETDFAPLPGPAAKSAAHVFIRTALLAAEPYRGCRNRPRAMSAMQP